MEYFLCSEAVIKAFPEYEKSKPFKSGYEFDKTDNYYIALLDFEVVDKYYDDVIEPKNNDDAEEPIDFWIRECVSGTMDVDKITLTSIRKNGLFNDIELKIGVTTEKNVAMTIANLSEKYHCNPIEFINKIVKK